MKKERPHTLLNISGGKRSRKSSFGTYQSMLHLTIRVKVHKLQSANSTRYQDYFKKYLKGKDSNVLIQHNVVALSLAMSFDQIGVSEGS